MPKLLIAMYDRLQAERKDYNLKGDFMRFWWFMFFCNMLYSFAMIIGGYFMWKHCPKAINSVCGYRTRRSKTNMGTWKFAHENCGKRWWKIGWIMLVPTILVQIPFYGESDNTIGTLGLIICIIECAILIVSIIPTERALKNTFNDDGTRK